MKGEWLRKPASSISIVFVHGINSDGDKCWRHDKNTYWPDLLRDEPDLPSRTIHIFTYDSNFGSGSFSVSNAAKSLKSYLRSEKIQLNKPLIFICHSQGGIVARKFIIDNIVDLQGCNAEIGLFLVASPSLGSRYANWLKPLTTLFGHSQAQGLSTNNEQLIDIHDRFITLLRKQQLLIKGKEIIEAKFKPYIPFWLAPLVAPTSGAVYFEDSEKIGKSDHSSIAKPVNKDAKQHKILCDFISDNFPSLSPSKPDESNPVATAQGTVPHGSAVTPGTVPRAVATGSTSDQRALELDYLARLQEEERLNQEKQTQMYTPLGGAAQERRAEIQAIYELFEMDENRQFRQTKQFENAVEEIYATRRAVLLGEPGGGKTTTIWKVAVELVNTAEQNPDAPIPLLIRLGRWIDAAQPLTQFIATQLGELGQHLNSLLQDKRAALLLDGLNELPASQHKDKYAQVQQFIEDHPKLLAIVSCRELDYTELGLNRINITLLDPLRMRDFVQRYLGPEKGDALFWKLAGPIVQEQYERFRQEFADKLKQPERTFWLASQLPPDMSWGWAWGDEKNDNSSWQSWLRLREEPSSLMVLARNPYMLKMLASVYHEQDKLPENRGDLFRLFVNRLLKRERDARPESEQAALLKEQEQLTVDLTRLASTMQNRRDQDNQGNASTSLPQAEAQTILTERQLYVAGSASILSLGEQVRFSHQLLQEYFAAQYLDVERKEGRLSAAKLWPRDRWWERTNWEEAAILLTGLYSSDCTDVILWLADANPEVAAQCLDLERSGAQLAPGTREATLRQLRDKWLPRLTDVKLEPSPLARAAVGRALGMTGLDNRKGVGVVENLPDIDWVEIPGGKFQYGSEEEYSAKPELIALPTFSISRYPITYAQFQAFLDDPKGYDDPRWFKGLAADDDACQMRDQSFKYANHPRETVNWYQAMAFCRWLSWRLGSEYDLKKVDEWTVRLPTEFEWEKAARGTDGRLYPYQGEFDATKGNVHETEIRQTSAVGIFPNGASPYGVMDLSGNVWEWCLSSYDKSALEARKEKLRTNDTRVLRGGSWVNPFVRARAAFRENVVPAVRLVNVGFRVVRGLRPPLCAVRRMKIFCNWSASSPRRGG